MFENLIVFPIAFPQAVAPVHTGRYLHRLSGFFSVFCNRKHEVYVFCKRNT